uniref:CHAT domain-containing tetratricopeptide repeat protein n=1 Tax=Acidisphaera sp. L21 TaxID=1641851 RepID=UPI00131C2ADD
ICGDQAATTILGGSPAVVLSCTRRAGGWPQAAMVASVDGTAYYADAILPVLPVLERSIGVLAGRVSAAAAPTLPPGRADGLFAARLAAQSFGANDVGQYEQLMLAGTRANLAESYIPAEQAFRAALALQQKALGANDPNTAVPLMHVALQLSDQGRTPDADAAFARAGQLAPRAADPTASARLAHYRALSAINGGRNADALALLKTAEAGYSAQLPPDMLAAPAGAAPRTLVASSRAEAVPAAMGDLLLEPGQQSAMIGVVETRRYQAITLRNLGRGAEADAEIRSAASLAAAHGISQRNLTARLYRTTATIADMQGDEGLRRMTLASADFTQSQPGTRPLAATDLLRAAESSRNGGLDDALTLCRRGAALLRELKVGTTAELMDPCLGIYATAADRAPGARQPLLGEMFEASQMAQGGITSQQIALASARLTAGAKDPRVGAAIRRQQDAGNKLADLERQRDALASPALRDPGAPPLPPAVDLDRAITDARTALADSDAALHAAAPQYGQLVQEVVSAADVLSALRPGEAFTSITLSDRGGWVFVLRDGQVDAARTTMNLAAATATVKRIRASIEPTTADVPPFDTADAAALYAGTLGRLQPRLNGVRALVVAPSGPLLSLPFNVLLTGKGDPAQLAAAPWLVRQMAISHVPAPANFVSLRRLPVASRGGQPWFGFGDFRPVTLAQAERTFPRGACEDSAKLFAGLPPLPFARRELDATRALLGGSASDELEGTSFTAQRVRAMDLRPFRVLHFATHALLPTDLRCQSEPAIVASAPAGAPDASGALITAEGVMGLDLDADVVILSACNSGGPGDSSGGESLSGLARSFFYAGARAMMVTHWSVNDQIAALLVADTMRRLRAGDPDGAAGALRGAELSLLDGAGKGLPAAVAHPFYWAPFALIGEGRGRTLSAERDGAPDEAIGRMAGL